MESRPSQTLSDEARAPYPEQPRRPDVGVQKPKCFGGAGAVSGRAVASGGGAAHHWNSRGTGREGEGRGALPVGRLGTGAGGSA